MINPYVIFSKFLTGSIFVLIIFFCLLICDFLYSIGSLNSLINTRCLTSQRIQKFAQNENLLKVSLEKKKHNK